MLPVAALSRCDMWCLYLIQVYGEGHTWPIRECMVDVTDWHVVVLEAAYKRCTWVHCICRLVSLHVASLHMVTNG